MAGRINRRHGQFRMGRRSHQKGSRIAIIDFSLYIQPAAAATSSLAPRSISPLLIPDSYSDIIALDLMLPSDNRPTWARAVFLLLLHPVFSFMQQCTVLISHPIRAS